MPCVLPLIRVSSVVILAWAFSGSEIPDVQVRIRRRVWSEDPERLDVPLHYEVEVRADELFRLAGVWVPFPVEGPLGDVQ